MMEPTTRFQPGEALADDGRYVPAFGFSFHDMFITDARLSECGRFAVAASYYGLTEAEADELAALNAGARQPENPEDGR
jgi:hypothetical protein